MGQSVLRNRVPNADVVSMMRPLPVLIAMTIGLIAILAFPASAHADGGTFIDDDNSRWEEFIETARQHGIVNGCNPPTNDRVCPDDLVTRGNMAVMLARAIGAQHSDGDHFVDDNGHYAEGAIEALIGAGARFGCDVGRFCPERPITRAEMAVFLYRTLGWEASDHTKDYVDLDDSPSSIALAEMANRGALEACDPPVNARLCPRQVVKRGEALFTLVKALELQLTQLPAISSAPPPIGFGDSFDELSLWDGRSTSYRNRLTLTNSGFRATALDVQIPKGSHFGADFRLDFSRTLEDEPDRLFFRYFLKLDQDWLTSSSGKLPGFSGVYGRSGKGGYQSEPWEPGWSARLMFTPNSDSDRRVSLGYYVYHLGQSRRFGDSLMWNEAGRILPGEWYCLEGEVELNNLGVADGALRAWVDGTPAFDRTGLEFRRPSEPKIRIESFWFNVYYGGKAVPVKDLGLTIDEVAVDSRRIGCEVGDKASKPISADIDSDGYPDRVWWGQCPGGACFRAHSVTTVRTVRSSELGQGAWFSLESHRLGLAPGDVDGDGTIDLIYRGRCSESVRCWRVHLNSDSELSPGENWGDSARFSPSAASLTLGDWNGDGLDDLVYQGICGENGHPCWRLHPSNGTHFGEPRDWGVPPQVPVHATAADVNGDNKDDLVYKAPCGESICWFVQRSTGVSFREPDVLGRAHPGEDFPQITIDFDGDGSEDLLAWYPEEDKTRIIARSYRPGRMADELELATVEGAVTEIFVRRLEPELPIQALIRIDCDERRPCLDYMVSSASGSLVDPEPFHKAIRARYPIPSIV